jgi:ribosome maturation factor RimP
LRNNFVSINIQSTFVSEIYKRKREGTKVPSFILGMTNKETILKLAEERMAELNNGLYIVELSVSATNVIHLELDKLKGGVTVDDCVSVSRNIEHNLDREKEDFELHVSSAGLDKPLRHINQFSKNIGRDLSVVLKSGIKVQGEIIKVMDEKLILESKTMKKLDVKKRKELVTEYHELPFNDVKEAKIVVSFK